MAAFKKTNVKCLAKVRPEDTPESIYWKQYTAPAFIREGEQGKEHSPIDYLDFSPVEPYNFAVSCARKVQIYNPITRAPARTLYVCKDTTYGGSFRNDGKLLCAGGKEPVVKLFEVQSRLLLRVFEGHKAAVHRTFFTVDGQRIASFSDDKSTILWDIPTEKQLVTFNDHTDYIRAGATSPISSDILLSGSYDKTVQMYDTRTSKSVLSVNHGAPVECVIFLPSGGIFISAGGTEMKVWDALAGGRLIAKVSQHHKTITCLKIASNGRNVLSGSLDRHVKIYDVATYKAIHTLDYSNSILSIAISKGDEMIAAGQIDGVISVKRREDNGNVNTKSQHKRVSYRQSGRNLHSSTVDVVVPHERKELMGKHDTFLRKFQYSKALDCVMVNYVVNKTPHVSVALLQELTRRKGLQQALAGRDGKSLVNILKFLIKYLGNPRFSRVLLHVANVLMDVYEDSIDELAPEPRTMFTLLEKKLSEEVELTVSLAELQGTLHMLLSAAESRQSNIAKETEILKPSDAAQQSLIHSIA